ncbi:MAG TPA: SMP-30/gluconolactonase/LRE family protein [Candidatus Limnocylindrales bacterium]|nr:SMP-30/gluconolactonase/LRE family protein [Candidatus Limnocylindrales bacterium]
MTSNPAPASAPRVLASGFAYVESARWHDGRLWFAHWGTDEIVAIGMDGSTEVVGHGPGGLGWSIDWLPDGRLLVTGKGLSRLEPDGSLMPHADLAGLASDWNELVVDGRGNAYVNGGISFEPGEGDPPGVVALVTPDGAARLVASGLNFPNGMVVTPDNRTLIVAESFAGCLSAFDIDADGSLSNRRVWAGDVGPDGICMDVDGAVWAQQFQGNACVRVREGGEILDRVELDRSPFSCMLGGPDGRTLFILAAEWRGVERIEETLADRTGQVLTAEAPAPHAGWP